MKEALPSASAIKPVPMPAATPTSQPLPKIEDLSAEWADGIVLTWKPQSGHFECVLERKDGTGFTEVGRTDIGSGQITDQEPGQAGTTPVYRLTVTDGEAMAYSNEASAMIPFKFGNTGGNLANGGISCEQDGLIVRLDIVDGVVGLYAISTANGKELLAEGLASQLNISDGYLYYLSDVANQNRSGLLFRVPLDGSSEPEQIYDQRLVFVLTAGTRIFGTLDEAVRWFR